MQLYSGIRPGTYFSSRCALFIVRRFFIIIYHDKRFAEALEDDVYLIDTVIWVYLLPVGVELFPLGRTHHEVVHVHAFYLWVSFHSVVYGLSVF